MIEKTTYGQIATELRIIMRAMEIKPAETLRVWHLACAQFGGECLDAWCVASLIVPNCNALPRDPDSFL
jgi:hypothetical protein